MDRLSARLREAETDEEPSQEVRRARIAAANEWRTQHGIPALRDDDDAERRAGIGKHEESS